MKYKLANLLFDGLDLFLNYPSLLYRQEKGVCVPESDPSGLRIAAGAEVDFTTYFNALSAYKWKRYTVAERFFVRFMHKGAAFDLVQCCAGNFDWKSVEVPGTQVHVEASDEWREFSVELDISDTEVLHGFSICAQGELSVANAWYYTEVDEGQVRDIELALATTTFKKESYVLANLARLRAGVIESDEPIARHFRVHVVDNGRTLAAADVESERIELHPNPNVGGSGGFARGMIEAMEQEPKATHVLLMDDDVEVLPESFIRSFNLLSLAKDKYAEAFLSGAMMSLEEPNLRTEDLGFFTKKGNFLPLKPEGRMTNVHDVVETEVYRIPTDLHADTAQQYAGWWYCAIPISTVERVGLPLPLFVRSDDAEYALRCKPRFMTMSGICVWHNAFLFKYSAAVERYQVSRNTLVSQATSGIAPLSNFLREIHREVQLDLKKFNYCDAELAVKGLEDFLRGPDFIAHPVGEARFMEANREKEKMLSLDELAVEAEKLGVDISKLTYTGINQPGSRSEVEAAQDFITCNGQRFFDENSKRKGKVAVIDAAGWVYPSGRIRNAEILIVVDMPNKKGAIRRMDKQRFKEVWSRYKAAEKEFKKRKTELYAAYAARKDEFTSVDFWKRYIAEAQEGLQA